MRRDVRNALNGPVGRLVLEKTTAQVEVHTTCRLQTGVSGYVRFYSDRGVHLKTTAHTLRAIQGSPSGSRRYADLRIQVDNLVPEKDHKHSLLRRQMSVLALMAKHALLGFGSEHVRRNLRMEGLSVC